MPDRDNEAINSCRWYVTEDEQLNYVHIRECKNGFCLIKDFFTHCYGKCSDYLYDNGKNEK